VICKKPGEIINMPDEDYEEVKDLVTLIDEKKDEKKRVKLKPELKPELKQEKAEEGY